MRLTNDSKSVLRCNIKHFFPPSKAAMLKRKAHKDMNMKKLTALIAMAAVSSTMLMAGCESMSPNDKRIGAAAVGGALGGGVGNNVGGGVGATLGGGAGAAVGSKAQGGSDRSATYSGVGGAVGSAVGKAVFGGNTGAAIGGALGGGAGAAIEQKR